MTWHDIEKTLKTLQKKLLELSKEFSKVAGYKTNIQKSVAFLYINNEPSEWEIKKTIHLQLHQKTLTYLGINLTKEVKNLYFENYKPLKKLNRTQMNGRR